MCIQFALFPLSATAVAHVSHWAWSQRLTQLAVTYCTCWDIKNSTGTILGSGRTEMARKETEEERKERDYHNHGEKNKMQIM